MTSILPCSAATSNGVDPSSARRFTIDVDDASTIRASASRCPSAHAQCTGAIPFETALASAPASTNIFTISSHRLPVLQRARHRQRRVPVRVPRVRASAARSLQSPSDPIRFSAALLGGHDASRARAPVSVARLTSSLAPPPRPPRFTASCSGASLDVPRRRRRAIVPRASLQLFRQRRRERRRRVRRDRRNPSRVAARVVVFTVSPARVARASSGAARVHGSGVAVVERFAVVASSNRRARGVPFGDGRARGRPARRARARAAPWRGEIDARSLLASSAARGDARRAVTIARARRSRPNRFQRTREISRVPTRYGGSIRRVARAFALETRAWTRARWWFVATSRRAEG